MIPNTRKQRRRHLSAALIFWLYSFCDDFTAHGHSLVRPHTEQPAQDTSDTRVNDLLALLSIGVDVMGKETPWDKDVVMKHT